MTGSRTPLCRTSVPTSTCSKDEDETYGIDANWIRVSRALNAIEGREWLYLDGELSAEVERAQ